MYKLVVNMAFSNIVLLKRPFGREKRQPGFSARVLVSFTTLG